MEVATSNFAGAYDTPGGPMVKVLLDFFHNVTPRLVNGFSPTKPLDVATSNFAGSYVT